MKKKIIKRIIIITIILILMSLLSFGIYIFIQSIREDQELTKEKMNEILASYESFNNNIQIFATQREDLYNKLENTYLEDFSKNYNAWNEYIANYEKIDVQIEDSSKILKENCFIKFVSVEVNSKCTNFIANYEAAMNYYLTDINYYNNNIVKQYNAYAQDNNYGKLNEGKLVVYQDYIDFDKDGEYFGKEDIND